ncbi:MAG: (p)ppGpp synthetase [Flavobacteriaceae bacterium]|nr:(p)ppGpp synthetase [Flavobacteriaceae bacterium]
MSKEKILLEYDRKLKIFDNISKSVESLIKTLLISEKIDAHTISCRVKDRDSLIKKIEKKDKYIELEEITDIVGLRIITHYSDDVDIIATLLEKEFLIDEENSTDKRKMLDPDRFGYLSLHYVASFNNERLKLLEYKLFNGIKFEIQIRSILQHTWAEIEHDIGYKSKSEVPRDIRRQFSRLAGLLEIADNEFVNIKNSLVDYERYVGETIKKSPENITIDTISINKFIDTHRLLHKIDSDISKIVGCKVKNAEQGNFSSHVKIIEYFGILTIYELTMLLKENEENIINSAKLLLTKDKAPLYITSGVSLTILTYVLAVKKLPEESYAEFLSLKKLSKSMLAYLKELKPIIVD